MSTGEHGGKDPKPASPAKFWLKSVLVIVAVGILLAWALMASLPEEPVYQGKTLGVWLKAYAWGEGGTEVQAESEKAIRSIGTNGIPALLRMIQTPDSPFRNQLQALAQKQSFVKLNFDSAERIRGMALCGFKVLGEDAKGAIPELVTLLKKPSGTIGRKEAMNFLLRVGPPAQAAVPTLLAIAADVKDQDRALAIFTLGYIHSSPESVVPILQSCLSDADETVRYYAVGALPPYGEAAKSAVPLLIPLLSDPAGNVRWQTTNALKLIDREAATKAGIP